MQYLLTFTSVNLLAVLVATILGFILGMIWYSCLYDIWSKEAFGENRPQEKKNKTSLMIKTFVIIFMFNWLYLSTIYISIAKSFADLILVGLILAILGFAFPLGMNYGYQNKSFKLWLIDSGYFIGIVILSALAFWIL